MSNGIWPPPIEPQDTDLAGKPDRRQRLLTGVAVLDALLGFIVCVTVLFILADAGGNELDRLWRHHLIPNNINFPLCYLALLLLLAAVYCHYVARPAYAAYSRGFAAGVVLAFVMYIGAIMFLGAASLLAPS